MGSLALPGDKALDTASPGRTFENGLGAQAPVGVWEPSGFAADGDFENLARRRQTELQRGRVSVLATMCYITLEIGVKLPGCLSPSAGLEFADIPNRLAAISAVGPVRWNRGCSGRLWLRCSRLQRPCGEDLGLVSRARKRKFSHQGSRRQGPPGWPRWLGLWLMCLDYSISAARVR